MKVEPIEELREIKIIITAKTWNDIQSVVKICKDEVSWFSLVSKKETEKDITYYIDQVYIPDQKVHSTTTEMSPEGQAALMTDVKDPNMLRCLGHSHVDMDTDMSGQDKKQFEELYSNVDDWFISAIFNKKGSVSAWVCDHKLGYIFSEVKVFIETPPSNKTYAEWEAVIKKQVKPLVREYKYGVKGDKNLPLWGSYTGGYCDACGQYFSEAELNHAGLEDAELCFECFSKYSKKEKDIIIEDVEQCDICGKDEYDETIIVYPEGSEFECLCETCAKEVKDA